MTQKQCRNQFESFCKEYDNPLQAAIGGALPDFIKLCCNGYVLAGRAIDLCSPFRPIEDEFEDEYYKAKHTLGDLLHIAEFGSNDGTEVNVEQLSGAYFNLLKIELQMGTVRIPCIRSHYKPDTKVRSRYGSWNINYSPVLTTVTLMSSLENLAEHFADCLLFNKQCNLITLNFKHSVAADDLLKIQEMAVKMTKGFNAHFIDEFEKKKDNPKYQIRNDRDPANL